MGQVGAAVGASSRWARHEGVQEAGYHGSPTMGAEGDVCYDGKWSGSGLRSDRKGIMAATWSR